MTKAEKKLSRNRKVRREIHKTLKIVYNLRKQGYEGGLEDTVKMLRNSLSK